MTLPNCSSNGYYSSPSITSSSAGFESTLNRMSKWIVVIFFIVITMLRHDEESMWATIGCALNSCLSVKLKHLFNRGRPFGCSRSDPGMPSSHSQLIFFSCTFAVISLAQYFGVNIITIVFSVIILAGSSYLSWLRVSQQLHTISQVAVGAIVGFIFSVLWFWLSGAIVFNSFVANSWARIYLLSFTNVGIYIGILRYSIRYG